MLSDMGVLLLVLVSSAVRTGTEAVRTSVRHGGTTANEDFRNSSEECCQTWWYYI